MQMKWLNSMKGYSLKLRGNIASVFLVGLFAGLAACQPVDPSLGNEYIPKDHLMKIRRDSSFVVKTYNVTSDSVISSMQAMNLLGGYKNPATGISVDAGIVFQMEAAYLFKQGQDSLYGTRPVMDSARVRFAVYDAVGVPEVGQVFDLYELDKRIRLDSVYYYDFDPTPYMSSQPLASVTHSGRGSYIEFRLEDEAFLNRLLDTTGYHQDTLFKRRFKSFYVKPRTAHGDAALYRINLGARLSNRPLSCLTTYYHNAEYPDTVLSTTYEFSPYIAESNVRTPYNQTINVVDRDDSGVLPIVHLNDPASPASSVFVESFEGIMTKLEFTKESIEGLRAKVQAAGFRDIVVNKALLQLFYPARDPDDRNHLPNRLGMYTDFTRREGIPDYGWYSEYQSQLTPYPVQLAYDGKIRPSRYLYQMDITEYFQQLIKSEDPVTEVFLAPSYETLVVNGQDNWSNPYTTGISGTGSGTPPLLVITYTMVR